MRTNRPSRLTAALTIGCLSATAVAPAAFAQAETPPPAPSPGDRVITVRPAPRAPSTSPPLFQLATPPVTWAQPVLRPFHLALPVPAAEAAPTEKGAYLGLSASAPPQVLRHQLGLPKGVGLVVDMVAPDSPAQRAGLRQYDVVHKLDDQVLVNQQQLAVLVRTYKPGDEVKLTVIRDNKPQTLTAKLSEKELRPLEELRFPPVDDWMNTRAAAELNDAVRARERAMREQQDVIVRRLQPPQPGARVDVRPLPRGAEVLVGPGGVQLDSLTLNWDDGETSLTITQQGGKRQLVAKDKEGKTLFEGPIDTDEQRNAVPKEVRAKLDRLQIGGPPGRPTTTRPTTRPLGRREGAAEGGSGEL